MPPEQIFFAFDRLSLIFHEKVVQLNIAWPNKKGLRHLAPHKRQWRKAQQRACIKEGVDRGFVV